MPSGDRVYDPNTKRWYKRGYSPEELTRRPIEGTCLSCGGRLLIYPDGAACENCSPAGFAKALARSLDRSRVEAGYMPASEIIPDAGSER